MTCLLDRTRESLAQARTHLFRRRDVRVRYPKWLHPTDSLFETLAYADDLLRRGDVVWGYVVQANTQMFSPGPNDLPGDVVFAEDRTFDRLLSRLLRATEAICSLSGQPPQAGPYSALSAHLADDYHRAWKLPIPVAISRGAPLFLSTVLLQRNALPKRHLAASFLPLLVTPDIPAVRVLPASLWAPDLVEAWQDLSIEATG